MDLNRITQRLHQFSQRLDNVIEFAAPASDQNSGSYAKPVAIIGGVAGAGAGSAVAAGSHMMAGLPGSRPKNAPLHITERINSFLGGDSLEGLRGGPTGTTSRALKNRAAHADKFFANRATKVTARGGLLGAAGGIAAGAAIGSMFKRDKKQS